MYFSRKDKDNISLASLIRAFFRKRIITPFRSEWYAKIIRYAILLHLLVELILLPCNIQETNDIDTQNVLANAPLMHPVIWCLIYLKFYPQCIPVSTFKIQTTLIAMIYMRGHIYVSIITTN